jgi:hypothetical protein
MKFTPKTKEELQQAGLLPDGVYDFEVVKATDKISKNGNDMLELQLKVWGNDGREVMVFDYLLEAMAFKLRHFAEETGLIGKYEAGELHDYDCLGKSGKVSLIVKASKISASGNTYPPKNAVKDYISDNKAKSNGSLPPQKSVDNNLDADIPF